MTSLRPHRPQDASAADLDAYRADVRRWLTSRLPIRGTIPSAPSLESRISRLTDDRARLRQIWEAGYMGIALPTQYGGQGLTPNHQRIWAEESSAFELPTPGGIAYTVSHDIVIPVLLRFGTEEQKREWIPKILSGEEIWVLLLSEPEAGSDLAGIRTRATADGDTWVLNGTKVWSSGALTGDVGICLARTSWDTSKHRGVTWFKVPLHDDAVTVRPLRQINGSTEFCEELLDDVRVGNDAVIGRIDDGWTVATFLLAVERGAGEHRAAAPSPPRPRLSTHLVQLAEARGLAHHGPTRQLIASALVNEYAQAQLTRRITAQIATGAAEPTAASIVKLGVGLLNPAQAGLAMEVAGRAGIAWSASDLAGSQSALGFLNGRGLSVAGGSNQIQRNIISERILGLPREASVDNDKPFTDVLRDAHKYGRSHGG